MQEEKYADLIWDHDEAAHKTFVENLAPIVLFTYNRLEHTQKTIEALQKNVYAAESELYIYSDGPKNEAAHESVEAVRTFLHQVDGFKQVHIVEREKNWGLAENIIDGVTSIVNKYGKIIVLEDDIVTAKYFLKYMNDALEVYKDVPIVMAVSGYCWADKKDDLPETFFLPWFACWGWGTWTHGWINFERNPKELIEQNPIEDIKRLNINGAYNLWQQIEQNYTGEIYTWAAFFYVGIFRNNGLVLYSNHDQCKNIGNDGSGEHCGSCSCFDRTELDDKETLLFTQEIQSNKNAENTISKFFLRIAQPRNLLSRALLRYENEGFKGIINSIKRKFYNHLRK